MLKIIAAIRRKPGMTHAEYADYVVTVHGKLATDNPLGLHRYVQSHVFDGAFGSGDRKDHVGIFHRDSVTELYFANPQAMAETFSAEYSRTVIAPDGAHFAEEPTTQTILTRETLLAAPAGAGVKIMQFLVARSDATIDQVQASWDAAHEAGLGAAPDFAKAISGLARSDVQQGGPGGALAAHFGGGDQPKLALVISIWVDEAALPAFRAYERTVMKNGLFDRDFSHFLYTREVEVLAPRS